MTNSVAILLPHGCWDPSGPVMTHRFSYANDTATPHAMFPAFLAKSFFSLFTFSAWILRFGSWNAVPKGPRLTQPIEEGSVRSCPSVISPLQQFLSAVDPCPVPYMETNINSLILQSWLNQKLSTWRCVQHRPLMLYQDSFFRTLQPPPSVAKSLQNQQKSSGRGSKLHESLVFIHLKCLTNLSQRTR